MKPYGAKFARVEGPRAQDGEVHPPTKGNRARARREGRLLIRFALWLHFCG